MLLGAYEDPKDFLEASFSALLAGTASSVHTPIEPTVNLATYVAPRRRGDRTVDSLEPKICAVDAWMCHVHTAKKCQSS